MSDNLKEEIKVRGEDLLKKIKELIHEGNVHRIAIKNDEGKIMIEIPITVGLVGVAFAPVLVAIGALAALAANFTLEVTTKEDKK